MRLGRPGRKDSGARMSTSLVWPLPFDGRCGAAWRLRGGRCPFERLVLTSPMIAVKGVNHRGAMSFLVAALDSLGMGGAFTPGAAGDSLSLSPFEGNVFTSDEGRFAKIARLVAATPELRLGGPTIRCSRREH